MPERNGRDLAERVRAFCPNVKILCMSGYTADTIVHYGILEQGVHSVQKPFTLRDLAVKVRQVLET